ncbi:putative queuosine biosynthesis protein [Vibrio phage pVco-14]|nr:putative queuosine biosynthesis protein [Vibrio phage pVco-14]
MNNQKPSPKHDDDFGRVLLHSIFPTIQGEGIFAGHPATFVRLAGCNLQCPACDTEYTQGAALTHPNHVADLVALNTAPNKLVVITGGEPLRQNIDDLVSVLIARGFTVQLETNGSLPLTDQLTYLKEWAHDRFKIMCSPKLRIHAQIAPYVDAWKYVLDFRQINVENGLPTHALELKGTVSYPPHDCDQPIYLQPLDSYDLELNSKHLEAVTKSCMKHGYILCLQQHKIIDVE